jgi:hypothetical protein
MADGSARLTCEALDDDAEPQCEECGWTEDELEHGLCPDCLENSAPTASELYANERTW